MIKDSFNSRFRKKAENQVRRSNVFHNRATNPQMINARPEPKFIAGRM